MDKATASLKAMQSDDSGVAAAVVLFSGHRAFLQAAERALQGLDKAVQLLPHKAAASRLQLFLDIWSVTVNFSHWFTNRAPVHTSRVCISSSVLHAKMDSCMAWLIRFQRRRNNKTLQALQLANQLASLPTWEAEVCGFLAAVVHCSQVMEQPPHTEWQAAGGRLPPNFKAKLCCLACDSTPVPSTPTRGVAEGDPELCDGLDTRVAGFMQILSAMISRLTEDQRRACSALESGFLPMVEFAKRWVCTCHAVREVRVEQIVSTHAALKHILALTPPHSGRSVGGRSSSTGSGSSLIPLYLTPDPILISHLLQSCLTHPETTGSSTGLMLVVVKTWRDDTSHPLSEHMVEPIVLMLQHCSCHLRTTMQQHHDQHVTDEAGQQPLHDTQPQESDHSSPSDLVLDLHKLTVRTLSLITTDQREGE
ncbi:MAG: hypothetical protein WDW38_004646 [Sanguina aurantia]